MSSNHRILLASHGRLAEGMKDAAQVILGTRDDLVAAQPYYGDVDVLLADVNASLDAVGTEGILTIVADIYGGSVSNTLAGITGDPRVRLVAGMNLGLVLELVIANGEALSNERITDLVDKARAGIRSVELLATHEDEEF